MMCVRKVFINTFTAREEHASVLRILLFDMIKYSLRPFTEKSWLEPSYAGAKVSWETAQAMRLVSTMAKVKSSAVAHTTDQVRFVIWSKNLGLCDNGKLNHFNEVDVNINFFSPLCVLAQKKIPTELSGMVPLISCRCWAWNVLADCLGLLYSGCLQ